MAQNLRFPLLVVLLGLMLGVRAQTTMEEYIYLSKTLKESPERAVKPGYSFGEMREWSTLLTQGSDAKRTTRVIAMYRRTGEPAGILMVMKRTDTDYLRTVCIPLPSSGQDVMTLAQSDFDMAVSDWPVQAKVYTWHLALVLAQEVYEMGRPQPSSSDSGALEQHAIDREMKQCLASIVQSDYDPMDSNAQRSQCYSLALDKWLAELKKTESEVLNQLAEPLRSDLRRSFSLWHETWEGDRARAFAVITDSGSDKLEPLWLGAQVETVKARLAVMSVLRGAPSVLSGAGDAQVSEGLEGDTGYVRGDGWTLSGNERALVKGPQLSERPQVQNETWVDVKAIVDREGNVLSVSVVNAGTPNVSIQNMALKAAKSCSFVPMPNGPDEQALNMKFRFLPR